MVCLAPASAETKFVRLSDASDAVKQSVDPTVENVSTLSEFPKLLLASLFLHENLLTNSRKVSLEDMETAFRTLLEQKQLSEGLQTRSDFMRHLDQLMVYGLVGGSQQVCTMKHRYYLVYANMCDV